MQRLGERPSTSGIILNATTTRRTFLIHDIMVTDAVNRALMGTPPPWDEIEARIAAAAALIATRHRP